MTWGDVTDNVGVTGYDIYLNNTLLTSVPASALTYTDNEPDTLTATYFVRAHDAAGNQSGNSNTVTRTGQTGDQTAPTAPGHRDDADVRHRHTDVDRVDRQRRRHVVRGLPQRHRRRHHHRRSTTPYTDTGLSPGTHVQLYTVRPRTTPCPTPALASRGR